MTEVETPISTETSTSQVDLTKSADPIDRITVKRKEAEAKQKAKEAQEVSRETPQETPQTETPAETKAEVKTETSESKAPEAEGEKKPEKKSAKGSWKKKAKEVEVVPATDKGIEGKTETKVPVKVELPKEVSDRLTLLDSLLADPSIKTVLKAKESGKDFISYYDEMRSRDPYKMSYTEIYKMQLKEQGLNETEIERKMEKFSERDEDDQLDIVAPYRKELKGRFDKELNDFTPSFKAPEENNEPLPSDYLEEDIKKVTPNYTGRELFGIEATPERIAAAANLDKSIINIKDGKIDAEDYFETNFLKQHFDLIAETIWEKAETETTEKLEAIYNVGKPLNANTGSGAPQPRTTDSATQKRVGALKDSLPK